MGIALTGQTVENLWAQAAELTERATREADHAALRRALVISAVAGSGSDVAAFRELVEAIAAASVKLAFADPQPLFDAAAALVAEDDFPAREAIVLAPTREPKRPPGAGTPYGILRPK
ncbi:MAG: hypothetical protein QOF76_5598 [Solirubrobacteraceae bacterium]|jgi:class 3 adenylate cyclase|nr:hypothetical protein [Solirubrobacteraceae bacterium]